MKKIGNDKKPTAKEKRIAMAIAIPISLILIALLIYAAAKIAQMPSNPIDCNTCPSNWTDECSQYCTCTDWDALGWNYMMFSNDTTEQDIHDWEDRFENNLRSSIGSKAGVAVFDRNDTTGAIAGTAFVCENAIVKG